MLQQAGFDPHDAIFVDDRLRNVAAADALGIKVVLYNPAPEDQQGHKYPIARTFAKLSTALQYL